MKKLIALLLALVMLFSLVGCALYSSDDIEAAREEGYEQGYDEGYAEGYSEGCADANISHECEYNEIDLHEANREGYEEGYGDACVEHGIESTETFHGKVAGSPDEMVYISQTGSKYHSNQYCSNMNDPECVTKDAAINLGRTACKNCY